MINLYELRYVRLGTRDIDAATRYAADILGLQLVRREGGWAYLRSDERDHTLVYFEGDPDDQLYFEGPDGMTYEYSTGVRLIRPDEAATWCPRQFPFDSTGFCMWGAKPDIPEFQT